MEAVLVIILVRIYSANATATSPFRVMPLPSQAIEASLQIVISGISSTDGLRDTPFRNRGLLNPGWSLAKLPDCQRAAKPCRIETYRCAEIDA